MAKVVPREMKRSDTTQLLLDKACPAIRYRILTEILGEFPESTAAKHLQAEILRDDRVQYVFGWQQADGYLGQVFHSGMNGSLSQKESTKGAEGAIRFLREMGVRTDNPTFERALRSLIRDDWFRDTMGVCWTHYPDVGLQGLDLVRAATLAHAGVEDHEIVVQQQYESLRTLLGIMGIRSMDEVIEPFKDKQVFKPGVAFPESYHLRLLAHTRRWRHGDNPSAVAKAVRKLVDLSPLPVVKVRHKSRWLGPAGIPSGGLSVDLRRMPAYEWCGWFVTVERFARMGAVPHVRPLAKQLDQLEGLLDKGGGLFRENYPCKGKGIPGWGPYGFGALERDWGGDRKAYDLTFRCLLILHHAGRLESERGHNTADADDA
jgi:hypothetical protein